MLRFATHTFSQVVDIQINLIQVRRRFGNGGDGNGHDRKDRIPVPLRQRKLRYLEQRYFREPAEIHDAHEQRHNIADDYPE